MKNSQKSLEFCLIVPKNAKEGTFWALSSSLVQKIKTTKITGKVLIPGKNLSCVVTKKAFETMVPKVGTL